MKHSKEYYFNKYYCINEYDLLYASFLFIDTFAHQGGRDPFDSTCPVCGRVHTTFSHIIVHFQGKTKTNEDGELTGLRCPYCDKTKIKTESGMLLHIRKSHPENYTYKHAKIRKELLNKHTNNSPKKSFNIKKIPSKILLPVFKCPFCNKRFEDIDERNKHKKTIHPFEYVKEMGIKTHHIKPWKDEESLFCDKDFLEKYLNKEIALGDECKE